MLVISRNLKHPKRIVVWTSTATIAWTVVMLTLQVQEWSGPEKILIRVKRKSIDNEDTTIGCDIGNDNCTQEDGNMIDEFAASEQPATPVSERDDFVTHRFPSNLQTYEIDSAGDMNSLQDDKNGMNSSQNNQITIDSSIDNQKQLIRKNYNLTGKQNSSTKKKTDLNKVMDKIVKNKNSGGKRKLNSKLSDKTNNTQLKSLHYEKVILHTKSDNLSMPLHLKRKLLSKNTNSNMKKKSLRFADVVLSLFKNDMI